MDREAVEFGMKFGDRIDRMCECIRRRTEKKQDVKQLSRPSEEL